VKSGPTTYTVRAGDTLERVARKHGLTTIALAQANSLPNINLIRVGQRLTIPKPAPKGAKPVVTLRTQPIVATKPAPAPTTPLSSRVVVVGTTAPGIHTVVSGETLSEVAAKYGTSSAALAKTNGIKVGGVLRIGARLEVPGAAPGWLCPVTGPHRFADTWGAPRGGGRRHMGTDMMAARGTPVVAPVGGRIRTVSGAVGGLAFYLAGDDGHTYYGAHLDTLVAASGSRVQPGGQIGTVGDSGNAKGGAPHLHFEIHLNGSEPVNPTPTLRQWC
jgi:murein DD-endopeptidase MepM/ murein hydrolase activator NlpD